jgi:hypothetical protein
MGINIKVDLKEASRENINSIHVAECFVQWRAFENMVMKLLVP